MPEITLIDLPYQTSLLPFFQAVRHLPYPAILDSNHEHFPDTQYDILVADPLARIHPKKNNKLIQWRQEALYHLNSADGVNATDNPMTLLNELYSLITQEPWAKNAPQNVPFIGGLLGFYGYESGHFVENLPDTVKHDIQLEQLSVGLYGWAVVSSHGEQKTQLIVTPWCSQAEADTILALLQAVQEVETAKEVEEAEQASGKRASNAFSLTSRFTSNMSKASYAQKFHQVQEYIQSGDCYQVNLAQRFSSTYQGDTLTAYQSLRHVCPTPFSAYLELGEDQALLSHSPERFFFAIKGE